MNGPRGRQRCRRGQGGGVETDALAGSGFGKHKRSLLETALLIALAEESSHGYALIERVQELVDGQLRVDDGSVYRILRLLEAAGMVSSSWDAGMAGPQRRIYTVEPPGRELLRSWATVLADQGNALLRLSKRAEESLAKSTEDKTRRD